MAAGNLAVFVATPKRPSVRIATANTNRDGSTGTYGTLLTAGANGAFYKGIRFQAEGTTTAGVVRIFVQALGSGNFELVREMLVSAITPSATIEAASGEWYPPAGLILGAGDVVKVSTHNAETFMVAAEVGGDY